MTEQPLDIVGALEIVARAESELGITLLRDTVKSWERRRKTWVAAGRPARRANEEAIPDPLGEVNGQPAWQWPDVVAWMERTGRLKGSS